MKKNHYSKQTTHPQEFSSWGNQDIPLSKGTGEKESPCKPKSLNFPLLLDENITYWEIPHIWKKGISEGIMPAACIQLHNHDLFQKAQLKLSPLIQNSVQQDYLPESYTRYLPSYRKYQLLHPPGVDCSPLPLNFYGKSWGWCKIPPNSQKFTHFPHQKNLP